MIAPATEAPPLLGGLYTDRYELSRACTQGRRRETLARLILAFLD